MASDTRDRIVRAAARLFHEQGFTATSVADVLDAAGVNSGSLYHFFDGKTALLEAVLERHIGLLRPSLLEPAERAGPDPVERVAALLDHYRRNLAASGATLGCPVGQLALELGDRLPDARAMVDRYFSEWIGTVAGWFRSQPARLPPETDPGALAGHVLAVIQGALVRAVAAGTVSPFEDAVAVLRSFFGLLEGAGPPPVAAGVGPAPVAVATPADDVADEPAAGWRTW